VFKVGLNIPRLERLKMNEYQEKIKKLSMYKNWLKSQIVKTQNKLCRLDKQLKEIEFDIKYAEQVKKDEL